ncbi:Na+/H+ antiporter subunit G [Loktanella agnita]|uniref:Na+/H+ antiporter subunit G n=1 Tax=Loktanella agnita TaxID=287097 RepID=UPI003989E8EB
MHVIFEILIALALIISGVFGLVGSYGLVKLQDSMQRLHAPTKATTLGVGGVLIASMLYFLAKTGHLSVHEPLIALFLFLTAPLTANFIAKAYMVRNIKQNDLPKTAGEFGWSPYDDPPEQAQQTPHEE